MNSSVSSSISGGGVGPVHQFSAFICVGVGQQYLHLNSIGNSLWAVWAHDL